MSLITLTDRLRAGRSMARTLLLLIALTGAVIVGLLAMHSLNTHTAADTGHHTTVAAAESVTGDDHHSAATAAAEGCADCGSSHSDMLAMACVLALLATVLLARLRPSHVWLSIPPRPQPLGTAPPGSRPSMRPPSLTTLCISRT